MKRRRGLTRKNQPSTKGRSHGQRIVPQSLSITNFLPEFADRCVYAPSSMRAPYVL